MHFEEIQNALLKANVAFLKSYIITRKKKNNIPNKTFTSTKKYNNLIIFWSANTLPQSKN